MKAKPARAPRYGNYRVTRIAATPLQAEAATLPRREATPPQRWETLWADKPLELPHGRALGLRHRGGELEVAFLSKATLNLRWEPAERVLTSKQAQAWRARSAFLQG